MKSIFQTAKRKLFHYQLLIIIGVICSCISNVWAEDTFVVGDFVYSICEDDPNAVKLCEYLYRDSEKGASVVEIPAEINYEGQEYIVTVIGSKSFYSPKGNTLVEEVVLPHTIRIIDADGFYGSRIKRINLPESITYIGEWAFTGCNFETVNIPNSIDAVQPNTFLGCDSLVNVNIPESVKFIGDQAFRMCRSLTSIYLPKSVEQMGFNPFLWCPKLKEIIVDDENEYFCAEGGMLFNKDKTKLICYPSATGVVSVPNGVTEIGSCAFWLTENITSVRLPGSVQKIGYWAFNECEDIKSFTCLAYEPPVLDSMLILSAGIDVKHDYKIYVPRESVELYKNAEWWKENRNEIYSAGSGVEEIDSVESVPERYVVYGLDGTLILDTADKDVLNNLPKGIYIVNGEKVAL